MTAPEQSNDDRIRQAWRHATDAEVHRTLCAPDEVPPDVYAIVEAEARRRNISPDDEFHNQPTPLSRMARRVVRLAKPIQTHYFVSAFVFGAVLRLLPFWIGPSAFGVTPLLWGVMFLAGTITGIVAISAPLLSYAKSVKVSIMGAFGNGAVAFGFTLWYAPQTAPPADLLRDAAMLLLTLGGVFSMFTCLAVYVRRRYWPVYPPGHCAGCGYNLFGLTEPRCPECGVPFDPAECAPEDAKNAPA